LNCFEVANAITGSSEQMQNYQKLKTKCIPQIKEQLFGTVPKLGMLYTLLKKSWAYHFTWNF